MKKLFFVLIPLLFVFVSCFLDSSFYCTVTNNTDFEVTVFYTEAPSDFYTIPAKCSISIKRFTTGGIDSYNFPDNIVLKNISAYDYEICELPLKTYTVYNTFSIPILLAYNKNTVKILPGEFFSFSDYRLLYSFQYVFNDVLIDGDNKDLIIEII